jgi:hypothetical protein
MISFFWGKKLGVRRIFFPFSPGEFPVRNPKEFVCQAPLGGQADSGIIRRLPGKPLGLHPPAVFRHFAPENRGKGSFIAFLHAKKMQKLNFYFIFHIQEKAIEFFNFF